MSWSTLATRVEQRTPADRDRVVDLLRVGSILVVVAGHWLIAVVTIRDGRIHGDNLLALVPATQWLTWALQVMPVFFFVGGRVNAAGWDRARRRGTPAAAWIRRRALRLLRPVLPLVGVWVVLTAVLDGLGVASDQLRLGTRVVLTPVWFLAVYLVVVALVPVTAAAHRRRPLTTLGVFAAMAVLVDVARRAGIPWVGWTNFLWVWGGVHQLGYLWNDGRLGRGVRQGLVIAGVGLASLLVLTELLGYPRSMVGVPGALETNNTPPSVALLGLAAMQVGGLVAARPVLASWVARPWPWAVVTLLGRRALTLFLWHQTAMVAVVGVTHPTGLWPAGERVDAGWWLSRPLWFLLLAVVLTALVAVFGRFEGRLGAAGRASGSPATGSARLVDVAAGVAAATWGLALLALGGLHVADAAPPVAILPTALVGLGAVHPPTSVPPGRRRVSDAVGAPVRRGRGLTSPSSPRSAAVRAKGARAVGGGPVGRTLPTGPWRSHPSTCTVSRRAGRHPSPPGVRGGRETSWRAPGSPRAPGTSARGRRTPSSSAGRRCCSGRGTTIPTWSSPG